MNDAVLFFLVTWCDFSDLAKNALNMVQSTYLHIAGTGYGFKENMIRLIFNIANNHFRNEEICLFWWEEN
jgi:hypothetical protein